MRNTSVALCCVIGLIILGTIVAVAIAQPPNIPDDGPPTVTPVPQFLPGGEGQPTQPFTIIRSPLATEEYPVFTIPAMTSTVIPVYAIPSAWWRLAQPVQRR